MNYIDIAFAAFVLLLMFTGAVSGFLASLISTVRFIIIIPLSYFASSFVSAAVSDIVSQPLPDGLLKILSFIICFVVFNILIRIVIHVLKKLQKKEHMPLKHTNALLGALFGLFRALLAVCVISAVLGYVKEYVPQDNNFYLQLDSSRVVNFLNDFNPLIDNTLYLPAVTAYGLQY